MPYRVSSSTGRERLAELFDLSCSRPHLSYSSLERFVLSIPFTPGFVDRGPFSLSLRALDRLKSIVVTNYLSLIHGLCIDHGVIRFTPQKA